MAKVFEDFFSEYQVDMIEICLEYANYHVDRIFIYCSYEGKMLDSNFFFEIDGKYYRKHQIGSAGKEYDTSQKRQSAALDIITQDMMNISKKCDEFGRPMPTEMKIIYDVKKNSLNASYRYDLMYSNDPEKLPDDIFDEWFVEVMKTKK